MAKEFVFALTEDEANALIEFGAFMERWCRRGTPLDRATLKLDEQMANQLRAWERCDKCDGSGWVEDEPVTAPNTSERGDG